MIRVPLTMLTPCCTKPRCTCKLRTLGQVINKKKLLKLDIHSNSFANIKTSKLCNVIVNLNCNICSLICIISLIWWVISLMISSLMSNFRKYTHSVSKKNLNCYGHERVMIKETKKVSHLPVLLDSWLLYQVMFFRFFSVRLAGFFLILFGDLLTF